MITNRTDMQRVRNLLTEYRRVCQEQAAARHADLECTAERGRIITAMHDITHSHRDIEELLAGIGYPMSRGQISAHTRSKGAKLASHREGPAA